MRGKIKVMENILHLTKEDYAEVLKYRDLCEHTGAGANFESWMIRVHKAEPLTENVIHVVQTVDCGKKKLQFCVKCKEFVGLDWVDREVYGYALPDIARKILASNP